MSATTIPIAKFRLGRIVTTPNALGKLSQADVLTAIRRHQAGDWGDLCEEDRRENELSLEKGFRLLSQYTSSEGAKFWVITEADRSSSCILMPDDY